MVGDIEKNKLNINDPDSIFMFGNDAQMKISRYTKTISDIVLHGQDEAEYILIDVKNSIESFETDIIGSVTALKAVLLRAKMIKKNYADVLDNIDRLELALKLQEAKILKDMEVLKHLKPRMETTEQDMCSVVDLGENVLNSYEKKFDDNEQQLWINRLEIRLNDLKTSNILLAQTIRQVDLLITNEAHLVDKILSMLGTTIPVWRTQVALLIGIENQNKQVSIQNKITQEINTRVKENSSRIEKKKRKMREKNIDVDGLKKVNQSFVSEVNDLLNIQQESDQIFSDTEKVLSR